MTVPTLYGLPHCDSCKKALAWLQQHAIAHVFVDYRAAPLNAAQLTAAAAVIGWARLINRASTTWRQLSETDKSAADAAAWLELIQRHPTLVRRPLLIDGAHVAAGFDAAGYAAHFLQDTHSA